MNRQKGIYVPLVQGTKEWLDWRMGHVGGSQAAIIKMGDEHRYSSPVMLWKLMTNRIKDEIIDPKQRERMDRGHRLEPIARDLFITRSGIYVAPACFEHPYYRFAGASLDGISEDGRVMAEIKAPGKENHDIALKGEIPEMYYIQIQWQFAVTGAEEAYYVSYDPDTYPVDDIRQLVIIRVKPNMPFIEDLMIRGYNFMKFVYMDVPPDNSYASTFRFMNGITQLTGFTTAGKDEVGKILENVAGTERFAYADPLKRSAVDMGLVDNRIFTDIAYKKRNRQKLVDFGRTMRSLYPDIWVKGVFNPQTGLYESAKETGVHITDCHYINEVSYGDKTARDLEINHRLIWVERPGVKPVGEEPYTTVYLRSMANFIIHNNVDFKKHGREPLEQAVLAALGSSQKEVFASDFLK
jgi:putative phage-type endonuclease